ncbi:YrrS family protein [Cytobacillus sp. IB215665]|uniref:YrrS family protein n=1 Tax=Cytobacillus sp. IB215665 TaxID=3097357 RepID=UPI002A127BBF|nr:YrrS family protein [Cytobacillus sp. IB215665]MDX8364121.1 YrrS family protein [Cytobacillus sp. IB215665]
MRGNIEDLYEGPRYERNKRRKRGNLLLNILIGIVILLIVFLGGKLLFSKVSDPVASDSIEQQDNGDAAVGIADDDESQETNSTNDEADDNNNDIDNNENNLEENGETSIIEENNGAVSNEDDNNTSETNEQTAEDSSPEPVTDLEETTASEDTNIIKTITSDSWQPVGTEQTDHIGAVYEDDSVDWVEMEKAVSYATGIAKEDYTLWFLGNDGHNKSLATISSNVDGSLIYKVYMEWVDNEGWKPTKVEQLQENEYNKKEDESSEESSEG